MKTFCPAAMSGLPGAEDGGPGLRWPLVEDGYRSIREGNDLRVTDAPAGLELWREEAAGQWHRWGVQLPGLLHVPHSLKAARDNQLVTFVKLKIL